MKIELLSAPFPKQAVHWRIQGKPYERNGNFSAMALAYLDARDVMDRLDLVCGPAGWQSEYTETAKGRVICRIGIRIDGDWVWKSDGAGDTAVEGEKGGISDAFKRAAVHWGIGRYLYRLDAPWVACEVRQHNGNTYWKRWSENPWDKIKDAPQSPDEMARNLFADLKAGNATEYATTEYLTTVKTLVPRIYHDHIAPLMQEAA